MAKYFRVTFWEKYKYFFFKTIKILNLSSLGYGTCIHALVGRAVAQIGKKKKKKKSEKEVGMGHMTHIHLVNI